jgi:hypothetical protein
VALSSANKSDGTIRLIRLNLAALFNVRSTSLRECERMARCLATAISNVPK